MKQDYFKGIGEIQIRDIFNRPSLNSISHARMYFDT